MKIRIIQENTVVVVTILDVSEKLESSRDKKEYTTIVNENLSNYIGVQLRSRRDNSGFRLEKNACWIGSIRGNMTDTCSFDSSDKAIDYVKKLKNSINLINHGTKAEIKIVNTEIPKTLIETLE